MLKCPRCGQMAEPTDRFCGYCGFNLFSLMQKMAKTQKDFRVSDVRLNLGVIYLKMEKYAKAIETFEKILNEEPNNLKAAGYLQEAKDKLQKVVETS